MKNTKDTIANLESIIATLATRIEELGEDLGDHLSAADLAIAIECQPEEEEPAATVFPSIEELDRAVQEQLRGDKDGGIDALTAVEIGLAFALGLLVAGSLFLAFAGRRR